MKLIICLIFLTITNIFSQDVIKIKGKTIDINNINIPFCPLQINSISTISNENGEFELHIPSSYLNDTIKISYIGFHNKKIVAKTLSVNPFNEIKLIEHIYNLNEVIVEPTLSIEQIRNNIILNFNKNFRTVQYNLTGFFRNYVKENNKYDKLIEGEVNIHSKGFNLDLKKLLASEIYLSECRTSFSSGIHKEINIVNNLNILINRSENLYKILFNTKYNFTIDKYEYIDNDKIIYLNFNRSDTDDDLMYFGQILINSKNWGIEKIIYHTKLKNENTKYKQSTVDSIKLKHIDNNLYVNYIHINNHYELSYLKMDYNNELLFSNKKIIVSTTTEYITNDFTSKKKKKGKKLKYDGTLINQTNDMPYHEKFWVNYNYLIDNAELENVKKDINDKKFNN